MSGIIVGGALVVGAGISAFASSRSAKKAREQAQKNIEEQNRIAKDNLKFQRQEAAKMEVQKDLEIQKKIRYFHFLSDFFGYFVST